MARHIETGKLGECLAAQWLRCHGFEIIFRNFRIGRFEIDLIARKQGMLHFIEVKASRSLDFGFPELRITKIKKRSIIKSVKAYLIKIRPKTEFQIDVLSVSLLKSGTEYFLFENIF